MHSATKFKCNFVVIDVVHSGIKMTGSYFSEFRWDEKCCNSLHEYKDYSKTHPLPQYAQVINFIPITQCSPKWYCDACRTARAWRKRMAQRCPVNRQHRVFFTWDHSDFKVWVVMKLMPYHGVLLKEYVGEILKSFDKFQVVPSSMEVFTTNSNGPLSPMVSRPSEGRAGRDTVGTGYSWPKYWFSINKDSQWASSIVKSLRNLQLTPLLTKTTPPPTC